MIYVTVVVFAVADFDRLRHRAGVPNVVTYAALYAGRVARGADAGDVLVDAPVAVIVDAVAGLDLDFADDGVERVGERVGAPVVDVVETFARRAGVIRVTM